MNNVILFGPPGIGKSTIIGTAKASGLKAVDLEDIDSRVRYQLPSQQSKTVLGAADLNPWRQYPGDIKVLLYLPQATYDRRRKARDLARPSKSQQAKHKIADWLTADWDLVIWNYTPTKTLALIQDLLENGMQNFTKGDEVI